MDRGDLAALDLSLSAEQVQRLATFERLLREHASRLGLVSPQDLSRIHGRHILDSLRAAQAFEDRDRRACDLGSGAGLPGIPLAVVLPGCRFVLCEPKRRRAAFLELAVERLRLANAHVAPSRAEDLAAGSADVATARAFAPLEESWRAAWRVLVPGGRLVYFAGEGLAEPEETAATLTDPEPPRSVRLLRVLANATPLVIMTRR